MASIPQAFQLSYFVKETQKCRNSHVKQSSYQNEESSVVNLSTRLTTYNQQMLVGHLNDYEASQVDTFFTLHFTALFSSE